MFNPIISYNIHYFSKKNTQPPAKLNSTGGNNVFLFIFYILKDMPNKLGYRYKANRQ